MLSNILFIHLGYSCKDYDTIELIIFKEDNKRTFDQLDDF